MSSVAELMSELEKWLEEKGFSLYKNTREKFEAMSAEECALAIEKYKEAKMKKMLPAPPSPVSPDEDLKAMVKALLSRVDAQDAKLAEQEKRIAQLEETLEEAHSRITDLESEDLDEVEAFKALKKRVAQLESAGRPKTTTKGATAPLTEPVEGKCQHLFTKGCNAKGTYCGVRIANPDGSEREKKYCKFHYDKVAVLLKEAPSLLGKGDVVAKERPDEWWADRCQHTKDEGVLKGQRCQRLAKGNGFCTIHAKSKKRSRVESDEDEDEEEEEEKTEDELEDE